jgi:ABC-type transport system involved in cytochrome bd biosynthesis fused ATPase/permease subunit
MNRKYSTLLHIIGITLTFAAFTGLFITLAIVLCIVGIYFALQLFFSCGWWASLLVIGGILAIYAFTLSVALEFIERKSTK